MPRITVQYDNENKFEFDAATVSVRVDAQGNLHLDTNFNIEDFSKELDRGGMITHPDKMGVGWVTYNG